MEENLSLDLELSHSLANYLRAGYQGAFASQNMLSQLGFHGFNPDEITKSQEAISFISRLFQQILNGAPVLLSSWSHPQTPEAREAFSLLTKLRQDLVMSASRVSKIIQNAALRDHPEDTKYLIASYARINYAHENLMVGFVEFGQAFTIPELVNAYGPLADEAQRNIEAAHLFYDIFTGEESPAPVFYKGLFQEGLFIPGILRTMIHDINKLLNMFNGGLTFQATSIEQDAAHEWEAINISPDSAGYWDAFGFHAQDFLAWNEVGVTTPRLAYFWKAHDFNPDTAASWNSAQFPPHVAQLWAEEGYTPKDALQYLQKGIVTPGQINEE